MSFKRLFRKTAPKDGKSVSAGIGIDKTLKSMITAFYVAAGASGIAAGGLAGASLLDQEGRGAFEHCVRGGNVCSKGEMEAVRRFELRNQWQISATMMFMTFFPLSTGMRSFQKTSARREKRDAEKLKEMSDLRMDLFNEKGQSRRLQEELADLKKEIAPYRAQAEADAEKTAQEAAHKQEAARIAAATGLQNNIGISKPVTLKRK